MLRWRKEWIWSERPITICAIVKNWTNAKSHWSGISARSQGPITALVSITLQRNLIASISWACTEHPFWAIIVCLTQVWQSLFPYFCDKTFEFGIQTWQTLWEHYYMFVLTYFLSQLRKILILLIRSHSKICPLPTIANNTNRRDLYCWQWANFTMGSN